MGERECYFYNMFIYASRSRAFIVMYTLYTYVLYEKRIYFQSSASYQKDFVYVYKRADFSIEYIYSTSHMCVCVCVIISERVHWIHWTIFEMTRLLSLQQTRTFSMSRFSIAARPALSKQIVHKREMNYVLFLYSLIFSYLFIYARNARNYI